LSQKIPLLGLYKDQLVEMFVSAGYARWRATQVWEWLYSSSKTFDEMSNIPLEMRREFAEKYSIDRPQITERKLSSDGTEKLALQIHGGDTIEMVFIPEFFWDDYRAPNDGLYPSAKRIDGRSLVTQAPSRTNSTTQAEYRSDEPANFLRSSMDRATLCVSSQIGCLVKCAFCFTGTQPFARNLTTHEIVGQVLLMRDILGDTGHKDSKRTLTNIVFMGMGEPLHNYDNVSKAIKILMAHDGLAFSKRRITLSTSGVVPYIKRCGEELGVNLAVSLHATNDKLRDSLMPINKQFPLKTLLEAVRNYPGINQSRRVTFEYVMLKDVNDSYKDARSLAALIGDIPSKVNLIPWNCWPGATFQTSSRERIIAFADVLADLGVDNTIRQQRGADILAACGQLRT
jgi:23S rRNA (adenine2503-C2)-methyltransferase